MPFDIFGQGLDAMLLIFIVAICVMVLVLFIGGYIYPMSQSSFMKPSATTQGINQNQYLGLTNEIWLGAKIFIFIIIAVPFVILFVKFWYSKDEMSQYRY
jgi:hypothetical protein